MRFSAIFSPLPQCSISDIDEALGVIKGVSVITEGEVEGHDCFADSTTLAEVMDTAKEFKGGVKVKMGHDGGISSTIGSLKNFRLDGPHLRADFHILKASQERERILEMAHTIPDTFGFSISFSGPRKTIGDKKFARCQELYSVDLVDAPAANPGGLFNTPKPMFDQKFIAKSLGMPDTATEQEVMDAFAKRLTAPAAPDLAPIMAKLEKLEKASGPGEVSAVIEKLSATVKSLETESATARQAFEKSERKSIVDTAVREGKVLPFTDEEIYGTATAAPVQLSILRNVITKLEKTVPLAPIQLKPMKEEEKKNLLENARDRAVQGFNKFFSTQTSPAN